MNFKLEPIIAGFALVSLVACGGGSSSDPTSQGGPNANPSPPAVGEPSGEDGDGGDFITFESAAVRPLAISADGSRLFATNTPNSTLDIFALSDEGATLEQSVPVGLEPVSVALRGQEAWVVNHLSDSISIVDVAAVPPRVVKTLLVGDEPRDIVFAGTDLSRAFITAAHRGQNGPDDQPVDAQLTTPGVARADVWVFDADNTGNTIGGDPIDVVSMFGDTPRALTVSPDLSQVYVAVMNSGNRTTALGEASIAKPGPVSASDGNLQPDTGLIVQFNGTNWVDETGSATDLNDVPYDNRVRFSLPDYDVFVLSANGSPAVLEQFSGVGTTLFNMEAHPTTGQVYVSNTEALNVNRFEGEGLNAPSVRGNFVQSRISIINPNGVSYRNLNKHLDHTQPSASESDRQLTTTQPMGMTLSADGSTLYVAGFGSNKVVALDTEALDNDSYSVNAAQQVNLSGGGPVDLVLDEVRGRLYTLTRFNNSVAIIDINLMEEVGSVAMLNPEPAHVIAGREFLYNAIDNSSHGDSSCGLCHVSGDTDGLAWDLGNPDAAVVTNPNAFVNSFLAPDGQPVFHPMKGPMTTQSFRGMANNGPMHWRGDRTGANAGPGESIELAAFKEFNGAFPELLGRDAELSEQDMEAFARFALEITYPPNPIRALDNSLNASQSAGRAIYFDENTTGDFFTCNACHVLDAAQGAFGTGGKSSVEGPDISQEFKVPHLRNMYTKVGKFGNSGRFSGTEENFGDQIRGFGFMHDGNMDTLDNFFKGSVFRFSRDPAVNAQKRAQVVDFVMAMDSDLAPIVGQQVTLSNETADNFQSDQQAVSFSYQQLREVAKAADGAVTFTCVPPGSGTRMGIDRNRDNVLDGD